MKNLKKNYKNNLRGITLISLVVTIIVLLILAGVTIATLTGDNGIINQTMQAKNKTKEAEEKEGVELAVASSKMEDVSTLKITEDNLKKALKTQFGENADFSITNNGDGSFTIKFGNTNRTYYVENTGNIIENDNILKISTVEELKTFRDSVNNGKTYEGIYVYLINNITLDINEEWYPIGTYLSTNTSVSAETNTPFMGTFDGKGYEINGLKITSTEKSKGLFGLTKGAIIKNLGIGENCNINNVGNGSGGIVGFSYDGTTIENCYNKANIIGSGQQIGGIAGQNCPNSNIINCYNLGNISSQSKACGGISGNNVGNINGCYNQGKIESNLDSAGGISGFNTGIVSDCYNTNNIAGTEYIGGIVGLMYNNDNARILNSYSSGQISSSNLRRRNCRCIK